MGVTDMSYLFCGLSTWRGHGCYGCGRHCPNEDIGAWDTSGVTTMRNMFKGNTWSKVPFNQDISAWAVHSVTDMSGMFYLSAFNQDIGGWAVQSVTDMSNMFYRVGAFNGDIGGLTRTVNGTGHTGPASRARARRVIRVLCTKDPLDVGTGQYKSPHSS